MVRLDNVKYNNIVLSTYFVSDVSELVCPAVECGIYVVYNKDDFYSSEVYIFRDDFFHKVSEEERTMILDAIKMQLDRSLDLFSSQ